MTPMMTPEQARLLPMLLTSQQVADLLAVSVRTLWRLVVVGKVPSPVRYNRKLVRWRSSEIVAHVEGGEKGTEPVWRPERRKAKGGPR